MSRTITGLKIREKRRSLGIKQNELAQRVGISPSYLNLIERNKRGIGGALLNAIGRELSLSFDEMDGSAERRLRDQLQSLAEDPQIGADVMADNTIDEVIARYPAWARAAARAYRGFQDADSEVDALTDRLAHDPALAQAVHEMLTEVTALRSTAEILADPREIEPMQRKRFEKIVDEQSAKLARSCAALASYFDHTSEKRRPMSAVEEAEEYLHRNNPAAEIENVAGSLTDLGNNDGLDLETVLSRNTTTPVRFEPDWGRNRRLEAYAMAWAEERVEAGLSPHLTELPEAAANVAKERLTLQLADAVRLPNQRMIFLGSNLNWDIDALTAAMDGDSGLIFRRIAALHRDGAPRAGWISTDASGNTLARGGDLDLLPRTRKLDCPLWPIHRCMVGSSTLVPVDISGTGERIACAMARSDGLIRDMLVFPASQSPNPPSNTMPTRVGSSCRICSHDPCASRREPSVINF
ncbi:helix-turn-helix domain-containing protein [Amaricoccus tamworthensis]|uniref:helix-turn-helix domain-containing protein n=1 Tax=Amaricoccus tamworthensis TaxID=57002 RepID=UPI003C7CD4D7